MSSSAGALAHPSIVAVYELGVHEGAPYVVTELLEGETLRARIDRGPISTKRAVEWTIEIASGLAAAHDKGIVHRDLKRENLFITRDERVEILDFGIAKLMRRPEAESRPRAATSASPSRRSARRWALGSATLASRTARSKRAPANSV